MYTRRGLRTALVVAALASPFLLPLYSLAQFQAPSDEELKMTAEPKAPGAAAIYLYREETVDDNLHYHSFYARIKVLTEKGKELATVGVPYPKGKFSVTDVKARTIHSDGTIIPLDVKPADMVEHKGEGFQLNKMVFTLPSVEVGSILEYRWNLRYDDSALSSPDWDVQQPYYVRKAHYIFLPYKFLDQIVDSKGNGASRLQYTWRLPKGVTVNYQENAGKYMVDVADVPATPDEDHMPPLSGFLYHVTFYYTPYFTKDDFWKHEGASWSKNMDHFARATNDLKGAVAGIVAPGDSDQVKAQKIYDAVMAVENTDYTRRKSATELKQLGIKQVKDTEDVWKQKSGSSDEIALLYLAMVRIAGLKAYAATVSNRDREIFDPFYMTLSQLDDVIVIATIGGKEIALDPGNRFATFGELDWKHLLAGGLRQSDKGATFFSTGANLYSHAVTSRTADLTLAKDGTISGVARITMSGPSAVRWRHLAIENDEDEVKKQFNEQVRDMVPDGVNAEFDHFLGLADYQTQLMAVVKLSGNMGTVTGKRLFLPGVFFESHAKHPFVSDATRQAPIDLGYADVVKDEVTIHIPAGFTVESAPAKTSLPWPDHAAFQLNATSPNDTVVVSRTLAKNFAVLDPKEYKDLHDYYLKVATADQQQLVLTFSPSSGGN